MNDEDNVQVKELSNEGGGLLVDEMLRTMVGQMFENDNDTTYLSATLKAENGTESELEFKIRILSINGISTSAEQEEEVA